MQGSHTVFEAYPLIFKARCGKKKDINIYSDFLLFYVMRMTS